MDPFGDVYSVYVYTDAIQDRRVGDMHAPLLRCCPVDRKRKKEYKLFGFHTYHFPQVQQVRHIGVYLRDRAGRPIPFTRGEGTVTLI